MKFLVILFIVKLLAQIDIFHNFLSPPQIYATPEEDDILINGFAWRAKSNKSIMVAKNDYTVGLIDIRSG